jgi:hypothetical protein
MSNLQTAQSYQELLGADVEASPYEYAMLFKADGYFAHRRARRRFRLLQAVDPKLKAVLYPGEKVYFATLGTTVSLGERFLLGWLAYYLNMRALVFTSHRALLLQLDSHKRPSGLVSQLSYSAIASVRSTWNGFCRVELLNEKVYNFMHMPRAERKLVAGFLNEIVQGTNTPFPQGTELEHLCPHCFNVVPDHPESCPACTGRFKSARRAGLLSFLFPGAGDWYLGHRTCASVEMTFAGAVWLSLVGVPLLTARTAPPGRFNSSYWITAGAVLLALHGIAARMAHHFARKGHQPDGSAPDTARLLHPAVKRSMPKPEAKAAQKLTLRRAAQA